MSWLALIAAEVIGAAQPAAAPPSPPTPPAIATPAPSAPAASAATPPLVTRDEEGGVVPLSSQPQVGESQIRSNYRTAEAMRGALDGRWRLSQDGGPMLYTFQFSDSGGAPDPRATTPMSPQVEGAWRDMRAPEGLNASGMFETVRRDGSRLVMVFHEGDPNRDQTVTLEPAGAAWAGDLVIAGAHTRVVMTRDQ